MGAWVCLIAPGLSSASSATACQKISRWLDAEDRSFSRDYDLAGRDAWARFAAEEKQRVVSGFFEDFLQGRWSSGRIESCVAKRRDRQDILSYMQSQFLRKGIDCIALGRSDSIQRFTKALARRYGDPSRIIFRMTGHFNEKSPTPLMAGFQRSTRSIYMDWDRIPPGEWLVILVHELLHSLDERLWDGLDYSGNPAHVARVSTLISSGRSFEKLSSADAQFLDRWIRAGLDRGLWAEYRAWLETLRIYKDGLAEGLWGTIPWLDAIRPGAGSDGPEAQRDLYLHLDQRSPDPRPGKGILGSALVLGRIRSIRAEQRRWAVPLPRLEL